MQTHDSQRQYQSTFACSTPIFLTKQHICFRHHIKWYAAEKVVRRMTYHGVSLKYPNFIATYVSDMLLDMSINRQRTAQTEQTYLLFVHSTDINKVFPHK